MDKEAGTIALAVLTIMVVFLALQPLIPPNNQEQFSEIGILGPQQTISNYPSQVAVNQSFLLYGYIGNHEGSAQYYRLVVKLGNRSTSISNSTAANAPQIASYSYVLNNQQNVTFPMSLSIPQNGTSLRLLFELWSYNVTAFSYTGLWNQLWINATGT